ncbi:hypothetical protein SGUI_1098 [Serinicoccus hydrothermalis]|uniref:Uncharacterized protein n=1 Tax=Serinicoccus hydrothermalis TaxID=1758689 RepID=A0A1B1NAR3_9MICO|nr:hypothetical protein SGUI_1098 [Serinicoccus hydrothermalis]
MVRLPAGGAAASVMGTTTEFHSRWSSEGEDDDGMRRLQPVRSDQEERGGSGRAGPARRHVGHH